ncbi:hypothetical protein D3C78_1869910 [compost metagenome]
MSIIAIINPVAIAITGDILRPSQLNDLCHECLKEIPQEHMPELSINNNTYQQYKKGVLTITLESMTYSLQLIDKNKLTTC